MYFTENVQVLSCVGDTELVDDYLTHEMKKVQSPFRNTNLITHQEWRGDIKGLANVSMAKNKIVLSLRNLK